jgi:hypothetical protein
MIVFSGGKFILDSGSVKIKTSEKSFDNVLTLFFNPNKVDQQKRPRWIRFQ